MEQDLVLSSFMSFLAADMQRSPEHITPLDALAMKRISMHVSDLNTSPEEDLGDESLIWLVGKESCCEGKKNSETARLERFQLRRLSR